MTAPAEGRRPATRPAPVDDLAPMPSAPKGGPAKAVQRFGPALRAILEELNEVLVA